MRGRRMNVPAAHRAQLSRRAGGRLMRLPEFRRARTVAAYLPVDGEIDPGPLLRTCRARGKQLFLPVIAVRQGLMFAPFGRHTVWRRNRFGIAEPVVPPASLRPGGSLDLVITPLVACDRSGTRLGMGGGFYDRCFAFLLRGNWRRPCLVGLAYGFQQVDYLPRRRWDVPVDLLVTDNGVRRYRRKKFGS